MPIAISRPSPLRHFLTMTGHFLGHVAAVVLGFVLIIVGLAMGVTMVSAACGHHHRSGRRRVDRGWRVRSHYSSSLN